MKKILTITALASLSNFAMAESPAGCGLGTAVVFPDANEWHEHVLAATTNGTSGNQTFGMTSGTLGCESANGPLKLAQLFIHDNMDQLAIESSQGQGETLQALAQLLGVDKDHQSEFGQMMQAEFDALFSMEATASSTYEAMISAMAKDQQLSRYI